MKVELDGTFKHLIWSELWKWYEKDYQLHISEHMCRKALLATFKENVKISTENIKVLFGGLVVFIVVLVLLCFPFCLFCCCCCCCCCSCANMKSTYVKKVFCSETKKQLSVTASLGLWPNKNALVINYVTANCQSFTKL